MTTRWLLACGAIGGPLFTVAYLAEGASRADYDPLRHPVSSLALGDHGWTQVANFAVTGLLTLAFARYSVHGALHELFSVLAFVGLPAACLVFARRFAGWGERGWAIYSAVTGVVFAVAFVLASMAFSQAERLVELGGLFQRIAIIVGWSWLTLLAVHLLRPAGATQSG